MMTTVYAKANDVDLDHVFEVHADGTITDGPTGLYAPEVWHVEGQQSPHDIEGYDPTQWQPLTGFTGQYGYNGAVLHASEVIGGGLEKHLLENPGVYVAVVVSAGVGVMDENGGEEPAGWAIFRHAHPGDCGYCIAGEFMNHTYEPTETS